MSEAVASVAAAACVAVASTACVWQAVAGSDLVAFPEDYAKGVHYATVNRGNIRQELYTGHEAIEAAKRGQPFPTGTVITLVDYRDGDLHRYVVMEKREGWGELSPPDIRTGDWLFREFAQDGAPNLAEDGTRCMSCHKPRASQDFVFTVEQMKSAE